jgi:hypothetical protein
VRLRSQKSVRYQTLPLPVVLMCACTVVAVERNGVQQSGHGNQASQHTFTQRTLPCEVPIGNEYMYHLCLVLSRMLQCRYRRHFTGQDDTKPIYAYC